MTDIGDWLAAKRIVERVKGWDALVKERDDAARERDELQEEIDRLSRTITLVWQALLKHGAVADNKTTISEFVDRLGAERNKLRAFVRWLAAPDADGVVEYIDPGEIQDKARTLLARKP